MAKNYSRRPILENLLMSAISFAGMPSDSRKSWCASGASRSNSACHLSLAASSSPAVSSSLIAASECEGFGLPLIEAARQGLPVIARDIPVFREVAGDHAFYYSAGRPEELADALER